MIRRRGKPSRLGPPVPAACWAWPPLVTGLATAGALAWTRPGLVPGIPMAAAMLLVSATRAAAAPH